MKDKDYPSLESIRHKDDEPDVYCDRLWYAIMVKPQHENVVASVLKGRGFNSLAAFYPSRRRWSDRMKEVKIPLFPGYVFGQFAWNQRNLICTVPGFRGLVTFGDRPTPVDEGEIEDLRRIVSADGRLAPHPFLRAGQRVRIDDGPFCGVQGILVSEAAQMRVVVSITLLQRSVAVQLDREVVTPLADCVPTDPHLAGRVSY